MFFGQDHSYDALAGASAIRSTANHMLRHLKANMGVDGSPATAAVKLAQQPHRMAAMCRSSSGLPRK